VTYAIHPRVQVADYPFDRVNHPQQLQSQSDDGEVVLGLLEG
jgi:hypothetical protein